MPRITQTDDRRAAGSSPMRGGALRCERCGTTWFDQLTRHVAWMAKTCRRCGGSLHEERRGVADMRVVA